mmetsp:Transcript_761/g.2546  ORF Transcript_761/g.2546 Transcript_761/m.2546 type:complete len:87 (+) Transcript_761:145-405(+)
MQSSSTQSPLPRRQLSRHFGNIKYTNSTSKSPTPHAPKQIDPHGNAGNECKPKVGHIGSTMSRREPHLEKNHEWQSQDDKDADKKK